MGLISELGRRNIFRMAALYAVAAWLIMQVAEAIVTLGALPAWTGRALLVVLGVGFPFALIFSWFYELTPEGISLEKDVEPQESITHVTGRRLDFIVIALLCGALLVFAGDKWWPRGPIEQSIAVLPFVNMSDDPAQEYISDGIAEDILNLLVQVPGLRVTSRSSSFSFKGQSVGVPTIAAKLGVAHVLEGSVRRSSDALRITAQLIDTKSDTHLWSETFDREFDDIFAIQDQIAAAVVQELNVRLIDSRPRVRETSPDAYALYLQGQYLAHQATHETLLKSNELFQQVLALDPAYVPAWDGIANNYVVLTGFGFFPFEAGYALAGEALDSALTIDPDFAHGHALRGRIALVHHFDLAAAARHYERALELDPTHDDVNRGTAALLISLGRIDEAMPFDEYAVERDPLNPISFSNLGNHYVYAERWDDAIEACRTALRLAPGHMTAYNCIGEALLFGGQPAQAVAAFQQESLDGLRLTGLAMAYHALGRFDDSDEELAELIEKHAEGWAAQIAIVYDYRNEPDAAFEWMERAVEYRDPGISVIFSSTLYFSNSRNDPRWLPFLEAIGFAPYQLQAVEFDVPMRLLRSR